MQLVRKIKNRIGAFRSGRGTYENFVALGVKPNLARAATKWFRKPFYVYDIYKRRLIGHKLVESLATTISINHHRGFEKLQVASLPFGDEVLACCQKIFLERAKEGNFVPQTVGKPFRANLLKPNDIENHPVFLEFATSPELIACATKYLGMLPILASVQLWWSRANGEMQTSQLFHIDQEDYQQLKLFVNITDVADENGPLTFADAEDSRRIFDSAATPLSRVDDMTVRTICGDEDLLSLVGPAGSAGFVDTSRCFHQGSRTRSGERVVLMLNFFQVPVVKEPKRTTIDEAKLQLSELPEYAPYLFKAF